jgi:hypothetical protein
MNCVELQNSLAEIEDGSSTEQQAHLKVCPTCVTLLAELNLIASTASHLREANEPSPRVWNSIEIVLRQEGLIRRPQSQRTPLTSFAARWGWARWMAPAAATLLILMGIYLKQHSSHRQMVNLTPPSQPSSDLAMAGMNDDDLLQVVSDQAPDTKAEYEENLRRVNEYIQDAKSNVAADPNDGEARRSLMEAYQEKQMLFEMATDHSLR